MADLTLVVGNQNYSSWSLRPYLALKHVGVPFDVVVVPLRQTDTASSIGKHSPAGRVPILRHGDVTVWDSLAICEYLADVFPEAKLWPADRVARARARSISAEMHSGFVALRSALPMNVRAVKAPRPLDADITKDIERVKAIWRDCRKEFGAGGPFLFGSFGNADAMFGPVVSRFRTYGVALEGAEKAYAEAVWQSPEMADWIVASKAEPWGIEEYDRMQS
jgi:glutathione S-transferase